MKLYLGLVHYPIQNKRSEVVTTSVTNLDIHDISRSCRTYGVEEYFIITPLEAQHKLVERILGHWREDSSNVYNPDRQSALAITSLKNSVDDAIAKIEEIEGQKPCVAVTGANFKDFNIQAKEMKQRSLVDKRPYLLLFGTGWGLHASVTDSADLRLGPINSCSDDGYNHLSVRSAVAIYLDRIYS